MPKIYKYFGFVFSFFVKEHLPVHVHVSKQQRASKIELHYEKEGLQLVSKRLKAKEPLTTNELNEAMDFVRKYHLHIVAKWNSVFIFGEKVTCEIIKNKI